VGTADDDSIPVSQETFKLPRALLNWDTSSQRGQRAELDPDHTPAGRRGSFASSRAQAYAASDSFEDDPTTAMAIMSRPPDPLDAPEDLLAHEAEHSDSVLARALQLWRHHPLGTAAIMVGVALVTYFAVDAARQRTNKSSHTLLTPAAALRTVGPIIVQQLSEPVAAPPRGKQADTAGKRSAGRRARETPLAAVPASKNAGDQAIASAQPKSRPAERSSTSVSSGSAGLPAWGAETVRGFSGASSSKAASVPARPQALTAKPAASSVDTPPPAAAYAPVAREQPKPPPVVAAKPIEPPVPVALPPAPAPSKPLTMEEMLNQVEEAAQAQRKKAGLKAPKTAQHDAELDALINGAMKKK
jgi:hypothetical protein